MTTNEKVLKIVTAIQEARQLYDGQGELLSMNMTDCIKALEKIEEMDSKISNLQQAEDDYYLTANYLLQLANRAYELFVSSEMEQKRQLLKLTAQNLILDGRLVRYDVLKPFDTVLNYADNKLWLLDLDSNQEPSP